MNHLLGSWSVCFVSVLFCGLCILCAECGYVDGDTPVTARTVERRHDGRKLKLVMSDEFEKGGRTFGPGEDGVFEAVEKPDDSNQAMQFYNASSRYVRTEDGALVIETRAERTTWRQWDAGKYQEAEFSKPYTSGMVQSWNKFCFTGGVLELSVQLPGPWDSAGVWPAAWLMGNLARATFETSTMDMWPWSYDRCGEMDHLGTKQEINACDKHPGHDLLPGHGRGAPEIDIFEVMPGHDMPFQGFVDGFVSTSLRIAPGITKNEKKRHRPQNGYRLNDTTLWYDGLRCGDGEFNWGFWGQMCGPEKDDTQEHIYKYQQDALSMNTKLSKTHFEQQHIFRVEWQPGNQGYLDWYLDEEFLFGIDDWSLAQRTGATIPYEPMYFILNVAMSHQWGFPEPCDVKNCDACYKNYDCTDPTAQCALPKGLWNNCQNLPTQMKFDFVRLYQDSDDASHTLGCSPKSYPTDAFIRAHSERYANWAPHTAPLLGRVQYWIMNPVGRTVSVLVLLIVITAGRHAHLAGWKVPGVSVWGWQSREEARVRERRAGSAGAPTEETGLLA